MFHKPAPISRLVNYGIPAFPQVAVSDHLSLAGGAGTIMGSRAAEPANRKRVFMVIMVY